VSYIPGKIAELKRYFIFRTQWMINSDLSRALSMRALQSDSGREESALEKKGLKFCSDWIQLTHEA